MRLGWSRVCHNDVRLVGTDGDTVRVGQVGHEHVDGPEAVVVPEQPPCHVMIPNDLRVARAG
jgi:hypothetical protein